MKPADKFALVAGNGEMPSAAVLASLLSFDPYVLAADGGVDKLLAHDIIADAVIGDFDSASRHLPATIVRIPATDQNFTDLDKSVDFLIKEGYETVWLVGATGDRLDHTYGALSTLLKYSQRIQIALIDDVGTAVPITGAITFETEIGQTVSLLALGEVSGITTSGLRWNLDNDTLAPGIRDGISNEASADSVTISLLSGPLIAYIHHG